MKQKHHYLQTWQIQFLGYVLESEEQFIEQIKPLPGMSAIDCADIYSRGYKARLMEVLGDTFEATWWILGDENFFSFAQMFVSTHPSKSYDLSDYGIEFPKSLQSNPVIQEIPFLFELAKFEWLFKELFHSADLENSENILLYTLNANPQASLAIKPSVKLWHSEYSVYDIWRQRSSDVSSLHNLKWHKDQHLILRKSNGQIYVTALDRDEFNFLSCFHEAATLESAAENYQEKFGTLTAETAQNLFSQIGDMGILSVE